MARKVTREVWYIGEIIGPDGSVRGARVRAKDRRSARRRLRAGADLIGGSVGNVERLGIERPSMVTSW